MKRVVKLVGALLAVLIYTGTSVVPVGTAPTSAAAPAGGPGFEAPPLPQVVQPDPWADWIVDTFKELPGADEATLTFADLPESQLRNGGHFRPDAMVFFADPGTVVLDRGFTDKLRNGDVTKDEAESLLTHELVHVKHFTISGTGDGHAPRISDDLLLSNEDGETWAAPLRAMFEDRDQASLEAIAACVETELYEVDSVYLAGECPAEYVEAAMEFVGFDDITA